ncbi:hypothetical protein Tco_0252877 [Tanacetum coccineum]
MVTNANVDYADLIWEDFKFQIDSRQISAKKKELLPFPRFTKLIIKYILSHHNNVSKRPQSDKHAIKLDAVLENLKFANKGEKDPIYGVVIPKEMRSDEIKASADYLNFLVKLMGTQPGKGQGKGLITKKVSSKETKTDEEDCHLNERQTGFVIGRGVKMAIDEGTLNQSTMKLKGVENVSSTAQFLLDMKKARKVSKDDYIIQQRPKGLGEGSNIVLDTHDEPSDSSSSSHSRSNDEEGFLQTNDEELKDQSDDERTKTGGYEKAGEEQVMDDQVGIEQAGKV